MVAMVSVAVAIATHQNNNAANGLFAALTIR
jgi:hypothetical protein